MKIHMKAVSTALVPPLLPQIIHVQRYAVGAGSVSLGLHASIDVVLTYPRLFLPAVSSQCPIFNYQHSTLLQNQSEHDTQQ